MFQKRLFITASAIALGLQFAPVAVGQEAEPDATLADEANVLDTVVVTSTKRQQNLQDIGQTVAAVSGEDVRKLGLDNVEGVINLVPGTGFVDTAGGGIPIVIIRGVGLQNFRINDTPTTAIYVDEIYQTSVAEAVATIFDVERVEVLKGPQGGLYGRNAVGGAIQVISARPNFDKFEGRFSAKYEEYDRKDVEAVVSGPISDAVAFRIGGKIIQSGDTYYHSTTGDFDHGREDRWAARALLEVRPSENSGILFKVHGGADASDLPLPHPVGTYEPLGLDLGASTGIPFTADGAISNLRAATTSMDNICSMVRAGGRDSSYCETLSGLTPDELGISSRFDGASLSNPKLDNSWSGASVRANVDLGSYSLTSISAYDEFKHGRYVDADGMPEVQQEIDYHSKVKAWSQEIRLAYEGGDSIGWVIGANYAKDKLSEDSLLLADVGLLSAQLGGLTRAGQAYEQTTDAWAVYGRSDWKFAPKYNFVLEARYTEEEKGFDGGTFLSQINLTLANADESTTYDAISGKVGLEYAPNENSLLYASISKGFKSGGYFGGFATSNAQLEPFDQETILAYEAGFKTEWPSQALRFNGAVFYYDRQDVQASGLDTSGIVRIARLTNIGDVEAYGAEFEAVWAPTRQLSLQGSAAWLETEVVASDKTTTNIFGTSTTESFIGARIANQPEVSANFIAQYKDHVTQSLLGNIQIVGSYRGEQDLSLVVTPVERAILTEGPYTLVDLRATIGSPDEKWTVSAFVTNLFDEEYRTNASGTGPAGAIEFYGKPRLWGFGLDYRF